MNFNDILLKELKECKKNNFSKEKNYQMWLKNQLDKYIQDKNKDKNITETKINPNNQTLNNKFDSYKRVANYKARNSIKVPLFWRIDHFIELNGNKYYIEDKISESGLYDDKYKRFEYQYIFDFVKCLYLLIDKETNANQTFMVCFEKNNQNNRFENKNFLELLIDISDDKILINNKPIITDNYDSTSDEIKNLLRNNNVISIIKNFKDISKYSVVIEKLQNFILWLYEQILTQYLTNEQIENLNKEEKIIINFFNDIQEEIDNEKFYLSNEPHQYIIKRYNGFLNEIINEYLNSFKDDKKIKLNDFQESSRNTKDLDDNAQSKSGCFGQRR